MSWKAGMKSIHEVVINNSETCVAPLAKLFGFKIGQKEDAV